MKFKSVGGWSYVGPNYEDSCSKLTIYRLEDEKGVEYSYYIDYLVSQTYIHRGKIWPEVLMEWEGIRELDWNDPNAAMRVVVKLAMLE